MRTEMRRARLSRGWTQAETAGKVGLAKSAYANIETGVRKPSYDTLIKLLDLFGYSDPRKLFGEEAPAIAETPGGNRANQDDL